MAAAAWTPDQVRGAGVSSLLGGRRTSPLAFDFAPATPGLVFLAASARDKGLLLLALGLLAAAGVTLFETQRDSARLADRLENARRSAANAVNAAAPAARLAVAPLPTASVERANQVIRQLNTPWPALFDALERAGKPRVALIEILPDGAEGKLRGVAETRGREDMFAFLERLKSEALFSEVALVSHFVNEQDRNRPLRFEFTLVWGGES